LDRKKQAENRIVELALHIINASNSEALINGNDDVYVYS
jgi:hypothetical protein